VIDAAFEIDTGMPEGGQRAVPPPLRVEGRGCIRHENPMTAVSAAGPGKVDPNDHVLVGLAMQEPQYCMGMPKPSLRTQSFAARLARCATLVFASDTVFG
jgi:hypothetical protein